MFKNIKLADRVYYIGVNDRTSHIFEALWPLPKGVSYNSYIIVDEKVALIDSVEIAYAEQWVAKIQNILNGRHIDYIIVNHMEPDHSSGIQLIKQLYPEICIIGNSITGKMVEGFYGINDNFMEVKDGDVIDLGHHQLKFIMTPMVHWPETMMTYDITEQILFTGDAFGCFGTLDGGVVDTEINTDRYWDEMRRYYSNIVGKYGPPVQKALQKLSDVDVKMICSTHGPVWKDELAKVILLYDTWSRYDAEEEGVVILYGSMYGNTAQMAEAVALELSNQGIKNIVIHNASKSDPSYIIADIFKYNGLIIGSPTYSNEIFPLVQNLMNMLETRNIKNKIYGCFGSFSWAGASVKRLVSFGDLMKWETVGNPVEEKYALKEEKYQQCIDLGKAMAEKLISMRQLHH